MDVVAATLGFAGVYWGNQNANAKGMEFYNDRIAQQKTNPKVYDMAFEYLPDLSEDNTINFLADDVLVGAMVVYALWSTRAFKEIIFKILAVLILRAISIRVTILPAQKNCRIEEQTGITSGCYDKLFSGHFATFLTASLVALKYKAISLPIVIVLNTLNAAVILLARRHYTNDVIMALYATLTVSYFTS